VEINRHQPFPFFGTREGFSLTIRLSASSNTAPFLLHSASRAAVANIKPSQAAPELTSPTNEGRQITRRSRTRPLKFLLSANADKSKFIVYPISYEAQREG